MCNDNIVAHSRHSTYKKSASFSRSREQGTYIHIVRSWIDLVVLKTGCHPYNFII